MHLLPEVRPEMLWPDFWLARADDPDAPLLPPAAIPTFNARVREVIGIPDVLALPDDLPAAEVRARIPDAPESARFGVDGAPLSADFWAGLRTAMAFDALSDPAPVRFALALRRTPVRTLPTDCIALKTPDELPFDRLQETLIDVGWPVAILHTTRDSAWAFTLTPGYWGWVRTRDLALADRAAVARFASAEPFLLAAAPWADVAVPGEGPQFTVRMGTRLPLLGREGALRRLQLPAVDAAGQLTLTEGFVAAADPDWHTGLLPPTLRSIIGRAFALLGEPYAWGGLRLGRAGRDCSGLVQDVWATVGVRLPRNSGQQARVGRRAASFQPDEPNDVRLRRLQEDVPPGALLFLPGHVMLYLGMVDGVPYAIHDLWGYAHPDGRVTRAGEVVVSALPPEPSTVRHTLLERLTHAQVIAPF